MQYETSSGIVLGKSFKEGSKITLWELAGFIWNMVIFMFWEYSSAQK